METELLRHVRGWMPSAVALRGLERLSGGANNETWSFDALAGDGAPRPLILRRPALGAHAPGDPAAASIPPATEAALLRAVAAAGVPVPRVLGEPAPDEGLGAGFVMARVPGETRPSRLLRDPAFATARARALAHCAAALASLHRADPSALPALRRAGPRDELALWEARWRAHRGARPVFELALRWLHDRLPDEVRAVPVHGDFRTGNLLFDRDGLAAVLDWELAHLGDPAEDLGWFCVASWRFGELDAEAGGFGTRDDWIAAYRAAGGDSDAARVAWWEVMGTFRWGVMCLDMAQAWRDGVDRSVERVAVGRRASETELDLLRRLAPRARAA